LNVARLRTSKTLPIRLVFRPATLARCSAYLGLPPTLSRRSSRGSDRRALRCAMCLKAICHFLGQISASCSASSRPFSPTISLQPATALAAQRSGPERASDQADTSAQITAPRSGTSAKLFELSGILESGRPPELGLHDCVAVGAVRGEPVSGGFPSLQGKYRGTQPVSAELLLGSRELVLFFNELGAITTAQAQGNAFGTSVSSPE